MTNDGPRSEITVVMSSRMKDVVVDVTKKVKMRDERECKPDKLGNPK